MKRLPLIIAAVLVIILAVVFYNRGGDPTETPQATDSPSDTVENEYDVFAVVPQSSPPDERLERHEDGSVEFLPAIQTSRGMSASKPAEHNIAAIETILSHYRFSFGENPVGVENFEITEQLLGKNPKQVVFIASDSSALSGNELIDQWGTPYFFHSVSSQEMEIVSAGPDQTLWTDDDIASAPIEGAN